MSNDLTVRLIRAGGRILASIPFLRRKRVLVADDDEEVRVLCSAVLERAGFAVDLAKNGRDALDQILNTHYAAIVLDLTMPHLHGTTLLSILRRDRPEILDRLIVLTGIHDAALGSIGEDMRAIAKKPIKVNDLVELVRECAGG